MAKPVPTLWLRGEVNQEMTELVMQFYATNKQTLVLIYLNSEGGEIVQAREIVRMIEQNDNTTIIAYGECASAATLILQAAKQRVATSTCEFLIHYGTEEIESADDRKRADKELKWMKRLYLKKCTVSKQALGRWFNKDTYMDAERALKVGLIDEVIE